MKTDRRIGSASSTVSYRHPLLARISVFLSSLATMSDPQARRRVRWTPLATGLTAILMALDPWCSLSVRCADALACWATELKRGRRVGKTYNGLLKALERQAAAVLPVLKGDLRRQARSRLERIPRTGGWILLAADGSKEDLPRTREHEREFGIADNGKGPQSLITTIVEVHTGLTWDWRMGRGRADEKRHLMEMSPNLPTEALLLADGYFVGYPLWSKLQETRKHFLIRVGGNVSLITRLWPEAALQRHQDLVYAWPQDRQRRVAPLTLRLIRVGSQAHPMFLLTNVLDPHRLSTRLARAIYRRRWGVELFYRTLKRTLGYAKLRSKTGRRARLELEWGLVTLAIVAMMGIDALHQRGGDPRRLSPAQLIRVLRTSLLRGECSPPDRAAAALQRALAKAVRDPYRRHAPKRSRYRPITRNTPRWRTLKPPRLHAATARERILASKYAPFIAA